MRRDSFNRGMGFDVAFQNVSGGTIPAYALIEVNGLATVNGNRIFQAVRPGGIVKSIVMVNGPVPVYNQSFGTATRGLRQFVQYEYKEDTPGNQTDIPLFGEEWGPRANEFFLTKDGSGWIILGDVDVIGDDPDPFKNVHVVAVSKALGGGGDGSAGLVMKVTQALTAGIETNAGNGKAQPLASFDPVTGGYVFSTDAQTEEDIFNNSLTEIPAQSIIQAFNIATPSGEFYFTSDHHILFLEDAFPLTTKYIAQCASELPKWHAGAPISGLQFDDANQKITWDTCAGQNEYTGEECDPTPLFEDEGDLPPT